MTANMDVSLDEILAERKTERRGNRGRNDGGNRNDRNDRSDRNERNDRGGGGRGPRRDRGPRDAYPRDGVRKSYRDEPRKIDEEWVHDRYDNNDTEHHVKSSRPRASPERTRTGTRVRVDNLHYDLTRDDLEGLFSRIGPVSNVELVYDRAGRSEGTAYVTYEDHEDARAALRDFDGANAKGQPIRLSIVPSGGRRGGGGGGSTTLGAGRPLADRISRPRKRNDDDGDDGEENDDDDDGRTSLAVAARRGIDRYVPGSGGGSGGGGGSGRLSRSRSPAPRRRDGGGGGGGGRRPGERRGGGGGRGDRNGQNSQNGQNGGSGGGGGGNRRPRKTQEELDAEMADYFVEGSNGAVASGGGDTAAAAPTTAAAHNHDDGDDTDMIL